MIYPRTQRDAYRRLGRGVVGGSITRGVARDFQFCTAKLVVQRSGSGATFVGAVTCAANWKNADAVMTGGARSARRLRPGYQLSGCYGSDRGLFLLGADAGAGQVDGLGPGSAGQDGRDRAKDGHAG